MKNSILIWLFMLAATFVAAQDAIFPIEGETYSYQVNDHPGSTYQWELFSQLNPDLPAEVDSYQFTGPANLSSVSVHWPKAGAFFLVVSEYDVSGCNNKKAIRIEVQPNNQLFNFASVASNQCHGSNLFFAVNLNFLNNSGNPLEESHFPVVVSYSINGVAQSPQTITYQNQALQLDATALNTDPNSDQTNTIQLIGATDANNLTIQPKAGQDIHTHTIFAVPQLTFASITSPVPQGTSHDFSVDGPASWTYQWRLLSPSGNETVLAATGNQSGEIIFDEMGTYTLRVQATDDNGCLSEWISASIEVETNEPLQAVADAAITNMDEPVRIAVLANDRGLTARTVQETPAQTMQGGSLTQQSDGSITYTPPTGFYGNDSFTYQLHEDANKSTGSQAQVSITVINTALAQAAPVAVADVNAGWPNQTLQGNVLTNDLFYDPALVQLGVVTIPEEASGKLTSFNQTTGKYTFVPAKDYSGEAVFKYKICQTGDDGVERCTEAEAVIQILQPAYANQPPVANDDVAVTRADQPVSGNFLHNDLDPEGDAIRIGTVNDTGLSGTFAWNANGSYTYTPAAGFTGQQHVTYRVCDDTGNCDWGTLNLHVLEPALFAAGLYANDDVFYGEGLVAGNLSANDINQTGGNLVYQSTPVSGPANGVVTIQPDGRFEYLPHAGSSGQLADRFVYRVCSASDPSACSEATAYLVSDIPEVFIVVKNQVGTGSCVPVTLDASASTGTGELSFLWEPADYLSDATSATPQFMPGTSTQYRLTVTDQLGHSASRTVQVNVDAAPEIVTNNQLFVSSPGSSILLDASESTGAELQFSWWSEQGGVIVAGANTSTPEVMGIGKYYLRITDTYGCTDLDSVMVGLYVQVEAVNDTAEVIMNASVAISVLENDRPRGELNPASITIVSPPENGRVDLDADAVITYTPNEYYLGQDQFVYAICNYLQECDEATVLVMVNEEALFIPNAFSPNGDGYNDYFEIKGIYNYSNAHLKVFNRWGNLVCEMEKYGLGAGRSGYWDGTVNKGVRTGTGEIPTGTYFYILDLGVNGKKLTGYVYIDR